MSFLNKSYAYSRMELEDPEDVQHRKAQFLIYKSLNQVDSRRRSSCLQVKICKLKIKIGRRLKSLRKSFLLSISAAKGGIYKQTISQLKTWKRLLRGRKVATDDEEEEDT